MKREEFDGVACYLARSEGQTPSPEVSVGAFIERVTGEYISQLQLDLARFWEEHAPGVKVTGFIGGLRAHGRPFSWRYTAINLQKLVDLAAADEVIGLSVHTSAGPMSDDRPNIKCNVSGISYEPFMVTIRTNLSDQLGVDAVGEWALRHLTDSLTKSELLTGYVTYDTDYSTGWLGSPYEQWYLIASPRLARQGNILCRGYYWANVLGPGHLERLGGQAALTAAANNGGMLLEELSTSHVLVRAAGSLEDFSDADLERMRALLKPALPKARYWFYVGPPLRILRDPGTAYLPATGSVIPKFDGEGDPPPYRSPWFDQPLD